MPANTSFSNQDIANLLRHVSAVLTIQGANFFRIKAFENAANSIEQLSTPVSELWQDDQLETVPGLGKGISADLAQLFSTGKVAFFDELLSEVPAGMFPLLDLPGIGPKMAHKLATHLKLTDTSTALEMVKTAAAAGQLNGLPGISTVMEKKILDAVSNPAIATAPRTLLHAALEVAGALQAYLLESAAVIKCDVLGSLRRRLPTVGDIDLAVCSKDPVAIAEHLKNYPLFAKMISEGEHTLAIRLAAGVRVDIKVHPPEQWGSILQHYTGSKHHNIKLRKIAIEQGLSLSEFGMKKDEKLLEFDNEKDFYETLGLEFVPPELRENTGEIEAAQKKALPRLVEVGDIVGDVHMHCNLPYPTSHDVGASSVQELLTRAEQLGYSFLGISDHNPKQTGLSASDRFVAVKEHNRLIDDAVARFFKNRQPTIHVLKGLEIDIHPNGQLALEPEAIDLLDYAIASIHSGFNQDRETTTQRILSALAHPKVKILGHPTGRKVGKRPGVEANWEEIAKYCIAHNKYLEINASPDRADLPYDIVRNCLKLGVKFIINTDSHHEAGLTMMQYGVWTARKGWLTKKDVINTSSGAIALLTQV